MDVRSSFLLALLLTAATLSQLAVGQDDAAADAAAGAADAAGDAAAGAANAAAGAANAAAGAANADAGAADAEGEDPEACEESWQYIDFLRKDLMKEVDNILSNLRDASTDNSIDLESAASNAMKQILDMRETVLDRIFMIRKEEIETCPDQGIKQEEKLNEIRMAIMRILLGLINRQTDPIKKLKDAKDELLQFRIFINNEVMRILMLPTNAPPTQCEDCVMLSDINKKLENLVNCAKKEDGEKEGSAAADAEAAPEADAEAGAEGGAGGKCMPPAMYFMELLQINSEIDEATERLFQSLFTTLEEEARTESEKNLNNLKELRENIEEVIRKLLKLEDEDQIRQTLVRSLSSVRNNLRSQLEACNKRCDSTPACDACGTEILEDTIRKMKDYLVIYNETNDAPGLEKNEEVRSDLIRYLSQQNERTNEILDTKINDGLDDCDEKRLDLYNKLRNPLWMLVNVTIFAGENVDQPLVMVQEMEKMLTETLEAQCKPAPQSTESCQWDEYQQIGNYIVEVDKIIQESLFKGKDEESRKKAQQGFVDIKRMFDSRVEDLFQQNLVCKDEALYIKTNLMSSLTRCMMIFMDNNLDFARLDRVQRVACTKELRGLLESRRSELLQLELTSLGEQQEGSTADATTS